MSNEQFHEFNEFKNTYGGGFLNDQNDDSDKLQLTIARHFWRAATLAAQRQPPAGYQLVPIEPTDAMLCILMQWEPDTGLSILPQYRAMLAAAPATPQGKP